MVSKVAIVVSPEAKQFVVDMNLAMDRMEKLAKGKKPLVTMTSTAPVDDEEQTETSDDDEEELAPKPAKTAKGKKAPVQASFDSDDEENETEVEAATTDEDDEEGFTAPSKKSAKAPKVTLDDVNDACKAYVKANGGGKAGRTVVLKLLRKNFGTESISEIAKEQYPKAMKLLAIED